MCRELLPIYGPFSIQSFGLMIALGVLIFMWQAKKHPLCTAYISSDSFVDVILIGILLGVGGSRLLFVITNWHTFNHWSEVISVWDGGLSSLGAVLAILLVLPIYLWKNHIPYQPCLDLIGIHAPLLHATVRVGCFLAGCCYGAITTVWWGISHHFFPVDCKVHPTQIYSALLLLSIFFLLDWLSRTYQYKQGQLFALYLILSNGERFLIDFFRGDQETCSYPMLQFFSVHQWIALFLCGCGILIGVIASRIGVRYTYL